MTYWPYLVLLALFIAMVLFTRRSRRRQVTREHQRAEAIGVGTEVMTTSGLYGTVSARSDDGTVLLRIAPGIEVKWALAALREASGLSQRYAQGLPASAAQPADRVTLVKAPASRRFGAPTEAEPGTV
ncbi:MAG: preprotein translocase subunit YajC [Trebonia sp.]